MQVKRIAECSSVAFYNYVRPVLSYQMSTFAFLHYWIYKTRCEKMIILSLCPNSFNELNKTWALMLDPGFSVLIESCVQPMYSECSQSVCLLLFRDENSYKIN